MFKNLLKSTIIYGLATILPRILNLVLTPLHIFYLDKSQYGLYQGVFAYLILGNVLLSYGMETAFFRFMNSEENPKKVQSTALTSIFISSCLFLLMGWLGSDFLSNALNYHPKIIKFSLLILFFDALCVIPFAYLRLKGQSILYSLLKVFSVVINLGVNLFFFVKFPQFLSENYHFWSFLYRNDPTDYVFLANIVSSLFCFLFLLKIYVKIKLNFDYLLFKKMIFYGFPILLAGISFSINEAFDRIFIRASYPETISEEIVGIYSACYKLGVFMTLFITAFKLGVEPLFFSLSRNKNATDIYANIMKGFVILTSLILLTISCLTDVLKLFLIPNKDFWEALWIVPFILMANLFLGIYNNLSIWYKLTDRTNFGAYISLFGAVLTIISTYIFIKYIGYRGAAIATALTYGSMMSISYLLGQKYYPIPYEIKKISLYLGLSIGLSFINFYFLDRNLLSGAIFIVFYIGFIYFREKNFIFSMLKR